MKKIYSLLAALVMMAVGSVNASAEEISAGVKCTYVNGSADYVDESYGEVSEALAGYNKISNGNVVLAYSGWGVNYITYLKIDASAVPSEATITKVTLNADISGSTDSKRNTAWGVGYNSSAWSNELTYNTADKSITTIGDIVNSASKSATSFNSVSFDITNALKDDADKIVTIIVYETAAAGGKIKNINCTVKYSLSTQANFQIKYVDAEGTELKEARESSGTVGEYATIENSDKNDITKDGIKYVYSSDNSNSVTITEDGNAVVTVKFDVAPSYDCSVKDNLGNTLSSVKIYDGDEYIYYFPYYVLQAGKFYYSPSVSSGTSSYAQGKITPTENTEITVNYTEEENTNVAFYSEAENISSLTPYEDGYTNIRMSYGKVAYASFNDTEVLVLPAGTYTLTSSTRAGNTTFKAGDNIIMTLSSTGSVVTTTSDMFTLTEETSITVSAGDNKNYFDYVLVRKVASANMSIAAAKYATFCAPFAVEIPEGVTASKATSVASSAVVLEEVATTIPANTPVVLYSESAVNKTFFGVAESGTPSAGILTGVLVDTPVPVGSYVLQTQSAGQKFYKVASGAQPTLSANKAYLTTSSDAKVLNIGTEETAIKALDALVNGDAKIYDLNGRELKSLQKGINLVKGVKVMVK